uniref:DNA-directed DNA polymerase family A palm domain-containing protein n=1 Tax=Caulerpa cliftonii TaxID=1004391 RepID=A0A1C9JBN2_9CHLO|nr:hypothetical protein [Caulerpa cliftonii]AOP19265.1 hypothetical protein [Caulerpa cliftonii]
MLLSLDTEYSMDKNPAPEKILAFIQLYSFELHEVLIFSPSTFKQLAEPLEAWLQKPTSVVLVFFGNTDLVLLSKNLFNSQPLKEFSGHVFDFFLFFRMIHCDQRVNNFAHWARITGNIILDKTLQKQNWVEKQLTTQDITYLTEDVHIFKYFVAYVRNVLPLNLTNSWRDETKHNLVVLSYQLDQVLIPSFVENTLTGICINQDALVQLTHNLSQKYDQTLKKLGLSQAEFQSNKQFTAWLTENWPELLHKGWPQTATSGQCSTSKEGLYKWIYSSNSTFAQLNALELDASANHTSPKNLLSLLEEDNNPEPINSFFQQDEMQFLTSYLSTKVLRGQSTQCQTLSKHIEPTKSTLHPQWMIDGGDTGRITAKEPAIQQIPRDLDFRSLFKAKQNHVLIVQDLAMIELIIFASLAGDDNMLDIFDQGQDLHIYFASIFLNTPYEKLFQQKTVNPNGFKKLRNLMKNVNFGMVYLMGVKSLFQRLIEWGIDYDKVESVHRAWRNTFNALHYYDLCKAAYSVRSTGLFNNFHLITTIRGRPKRCSEDDGIQEFFNQSSIKASVPSIVNFPIQGTCADILKTTVRVFLLLKQKSLVEGELLITAHDEIVVQCPSKNAVETDKPLHTLLTSIGNSILQSAIDRPIHIKVESGVGDTWAEKA